MEDMELDELIHFADHRLDVGSSGSKAGNTGAKDRRGAGQLDLRHPGDLALLERSQEAGDVKTVTSETHQR